MATDAEIVRRVLALHDRAAYCDLVRKYQVEVRSYLTRLTQNRDWASDLAQEVFLHAFRHLDQLKDHARFRAWMYAIAHSQFLQWRRSHESFEAEADHDEAREGMEEGDPFAATEIRQLFRQLRPEECSALTLCLGHEFTHQEAAQMLGLPLGTVKTLILRAREKIGVPV